MLRLLFFSNAVPSYKYHRSISQFFILEKMLLSLVFLVVGAAVAFGGEEVHVVNMFQKSVFVKVFFSVERRVF